MEVSGQLHAPTALPQRERERPRIHCIEAQWAPEPVWTQWRREKNPIVAPTGNRILVVQPELPRFHIETSDTAYRSSRGPMSDEVEFTAWTRGLRSLPSSIARTLGQRTSSGSARSMDISRDLLCLMLPCLEVLRWADHPPKGPLNVLRFVSPELILNLMINWNTILPYDLMMTARVRFPAGAGNFSLHHHVQNGFGAHPDS
jgi:hypothetical protein